MALGREPLGLVGDVLAGADKAQGLDRLVAVVEQASQVFARGCPAVIEEDGLAGVEARLDLLGPVGAELGVDGGHDGRVLVLTGFGGRSRHAQFVEHVTGGGGEHAVGTGDLLREGVERRGIHHGTAG